MAEKEIIMAKQKELKRLHIIHKAIEGAITQAEAAGDQHDRRSKQVLRDELLG